MAENSKIEWTDATWNPWRGCTKVSPGCDNCYMFSDQRRYGRDPEVVVRCKTWGDPLKWQRECEAAGTRKLVFTCSWSDWFHRDADDWRAEAWEVSKSTPNLTYQILTKRASRIGANLPADWGDGYPNVWLGVSTEDQKRYEQRRHHLLRCNAAVTFLSCEPLLGPIDLGDDFWESGNRVDWVIVGGESGHGARPMHPQWVRDLRDQCQSAGVPFFFKQWGEWIGGDHPIARDHAKRHEDMKAAGNVHVWPFNMPSGPPYFGMNFNLRVGKKAAGRLLDGREWNEYPAPAPGAPT